MACKYLIAACLQCCPVFFMNAAAQEIPHFIEKLTAREGLSSNKIKDLAQDDNGFLWVATSDGLNRFDGTEVIQYFYHEQANSIPHNYVYCLKKLPGNHLAIGTQAGLSFYDGNSGVFRNFYYACNSPLDEYNNAIIELETDAKGNLWAASRNCIYIFSPRHVLKKVLASPFTEADAKKQRLRFVEKMLPLSDGHVLLCLYDGWRVATAGGDSLGCLLSSSYTAAFGFLRAGVSVPVAAAGNNERYYPAGSLFKVFGRYFLFIPPKADSLLLLDEKGQKQGSCYFPYNKYPYVLWSQQVVAPDSGRLLFLFHNYGLGVVSVRWEKNKPRLTGISSLLFETSEYSTALCDRQGNWWLATTEKGLEKVSPRKQAFMSGALINDSTGKPSSGEAESFCRHNNTLWVATYGDGFFGIDLQSGLQRHYRLRHTGDDTWANFIWNIRQVSDDTLWVGTQTGLFWYCLSRRRQGRIAAYPGRPAALDSVAVTTQFTDSRGLVWMGLGRGRGLCCFDQSHRCFSWFPGGQQEGYPLRYPNNIAEDAKGDLWFANDASSSLVHWGRGDGRFRIVAMPAGQRKLLSNLYGIYCESDSVLWLGTIASGLLKYNPLKDTLTSYGHDRGLINSHINSIYADGGGRLWLVTDAGLSCFDRQTGMFYNYTESEGLPLRSPTAFFYYDAADRRLYGGGRGAYFYFDPEKMRNSRAPQTTIITAMLVNGRSFMPEPGKSPVFSLQQNDISIHYAAVDLSGGPETKYAYKLLGEDTGWIMAGRQRQINFSHLAPGHYTFMVCTQSDGGVAGGHAAVLRFYIRPPFEQTLWFYGLVLAAVAALFYFLYRWRLRQLTKTEQMRAEISRNLHDEVGSTLTNISLGSLLAQKQLQQEGTVNKLLERIYQDSQTVSQTMREIVWSINPNIDTLGEALPRMLQYASELLEAKGIELQAEIAPEIEHIRLGMQQRRDLYLIFKEAVTNLARHSEAAHAGIRLRLSGDALVMTISDDGKGFCTPGSFAGNGLRNMMERAKSHQWLLNIQSETGAGSVLTLKAVIA